MDKPTVGDALARLEAAIVLLERATEAKNRAYHAIEQRHAALRTHVQETIERLDALAGGEAAG